MFLLNNAPLAIDTPFTHNGFQYPANWLRMASLEEKAALGITEQPDPVVEQPKPDLAVMKKQAITNAKQQAANELSKTDWMIIRKFERGTEIPQETVDQRDFIHTKIDQIEAAIHKAESIDALQKVDMNMSMDLIQKKTNTNKK